MASPNFWPTSQPSSSTSPLDINNQFLHPFAVSPANSVSSFSSSASLSSSVVSHNGVSVIRSSSAGSKLGRNREHAKIACGPCQNKKAGCEGGMPPKDGAAGVSCIKCKQNDTRCTWDKTDHRRTITKERAAELEQVEAQLPGLLDRNRLLEERLRLEGIYDVDLERDGKTDTNLEEETGLAWDLVGMKEVLVRGNTGSLSTYACPSHLTHLQSSASPNLSATALPNDLPFLPAELQMQALEAFFTRSGTEFLPLRQFLIGAVQRALVDPSMFSSAVPPNADNPIPLTRPLYCALLAVALPFALHSNAYDATTPSLFATHAALNLSGLLLAPSLSNVLALGLLATYYAGEGQHDVGWQYAGMSARMMQSLGLHLDYAPTRKCDPAWALSPNERLFRNLVYWIVFIQDKFWSMWLGRAALVADCEEVPLPDAKPNSETELIFQALSDLLRVAYKVMPAVYRAERTTGVVVITKCRIDLGRWLERLPTALKPTHKVMTHPSIALRHLHLTYHWLSILLNRPFYRPACQPDHKLAVDRCDRSLKHVMHLLEPWLLDSSLPLTPLGVQIVLSAGLTWLQSVVASGHSSKRRREGLGHAHQCLNLLVTQGLSLPCATEFAGILRRAMERVSNSCDIDGRESMPSPHSIMPPIPSDYQQHDIMPTPMHDSSGFEYPSDLLHFSAYDNFNAQSSQSSGSQHLTSPDTTISTGLNDFLGEDITLLQPWIEAGGSQATGEIFTMELDGLSVRANSPMRRRGGRDDTAMPWLQSSMHG